MQNWKIKCMVRRIEDLNIALYKIIIILNQLLTHLKTIKIFKI